MGSNTIEGLASARARIDEAIAEERAHGHSEALVQAIVRAQQDLARVLDVQQRIAQRADTEGGGRAA